MELMNLLATRRTYRRFEQKAIAPEIVEEILEAARLASSAANKQPLSYVVVQKPEQVDTVFAHTLWAGYLPKDQGTPKKEEQPTLFIGVVKNVDINPDCDTDAGLAISNMTLAAWNRGVGSCIIGSCNRKVLSEMFGLTENQRLHMLVAFGYPTHESYVEDVKDNADPDAIKYYLDEKKDYVVPKRKLADVVKYL